MSSNDKIWGLCVHNSLLKIGLGILGGALFSNITETGIGIILGAIGSAVVVSEMPMVVGTGLGIGWAVRHCKNLLRTQADPIQQPAETAEDPCACCNSNFEALDKDEFESNDEPTAPNLDPPNPEPTGCYEEERCTCNEIPVEWSPPRPEEDDSLGCSCYR